MDVGLPYQSLVDALPTLDAEAVTTQSYYGDMDIPTGSQLRKSKFWAKVQPDERGCWVWTGATDPKGYGSCSTAYGAGRAHRVAWTDLRGPIPQGLHVDHLCHVRNCVNPDHLRLATPQQNSENRRGLRRGNTSGHRGVMWYPRYGKWVAKVGHNGKVITLGYFTELEDAAAAAAGARQRLHTPVPQI